MAGENEAADGGEGAGNEAGSEESGAFGSPNDESGAFGAPEGEAGGEGGEGDAGASSSSSEDGGDESDGGSEQGTTGAPEQYADFSFPEGVVADEAEMALFVEEAQAAGLNQEQAQARLDNLLQWKARQDEAAANYWKERTEKWTGESRTQGLFRGTTLNEAQQGLKLLDGGGDLGPLLKQMGLDRHPAIISAFSEYGRAHSEDSIETTGPGGGAEETTAADVLFDGPSGEAGAS